MSGNRRGGLKSAETNRERYGEDFYREIGRKGGRNGHNGGFGSKNVGKDGLTGIERARKCGVIGGLKSKRGPAKKKTDDCE